MKLANVFKKPNQKKYISVSRSVEIPKGLWKKCNVCKAPIMADDVKQGYYICPKCGHYFRMHAMDRISMIVDPDTFESWDEGLCSENPMGYKGYDEKVKMLREKTGIDEAVITGQAKISGMDIVLAVCDGRFMMASMGKVVGEKIARAVERATQRHLPIVMFACSGGARMQEGIHSLMQMAKTSAALKRHHDAGGLYISVLTDPTTGGVTASFAMLGDVILAEPGALIGFAGPRVIEQTIGQKLPDGFQSAEFLLEHGFIDKIVERAKLRDVLSQIIHLHVRSGKDRSMAENADTFVTRGNMENDGAASLNKSVRMRGKAAAQDNHTIAAWDRVMLSRKKDRPVGTDYIRMLFSDFVEFHGDRYFKDDPAVVGGIADFHGIPVTVIAQAKGKNTKENILRNYGMPSPEGYRKALRLMKQAEKFGRPIICFVDTPGAFCGIEAEERGQGEAIARNLFEMSGIKAPIVSIIIGEGGSGGALAMAAGDAVWMLENAVYSILSPEGFASILWKDSSLAKKAAGIMKLTANDLKAAGIVEQVFDEPEGFNVENLETVTSQIDIGLQAFLNHYMNMEDDKLLDRRYNRFRNM